MKIRVSVQNPSLNSTLVEDGYNVKMEQKPLPKEVIVISISISSKFKTLKQYNLKINTLNYKNLHLFTIKMEKFSKIILRDFVKFLMIINV